MRKETKQLFEETKRRGATWVERNMAAIALHAVGEERERIARLLEWVGVDPYVIHSVRNGEHWNPEYGE